MNEAFAVDLQFAFSIDIPNINILTDTSQVHLEYFCICCHHLTQRVISARAGVH